MKHTGILCDGIRRRDFLRVGGAGLFGAAWTLPDLLNQQAMATHFEADLSKNDRSLIVVFLRGGLSTIDTWDLKPDAPSEIRGEFDPIATSVPNLSRETTHRG